MFTMDCDNETNQIFAALQKISAKSLYEKKNWYSSVAREYEATRPAYPRKLIDQIIEYCRISTSSKLVEIGAGPATATVSFAESGCDILCLEPNSDFCVIAREKLLSYPRVEVLCSSLEDSTLGSGAFDAVLAANSMHCISPKLASTKSILP